MWDIAKKYNTSVDELIALNPKSKNVIFPGDLLRLKPDKVKYTVNIRKERENENNLNKNNISAILGYKHSRNYAIIDKANRTLKIYNPENKELYSTSNFSTGASGDDYNTKTLTDKNGKLLNMKGNNSTPAGILLISGRGEYHGYPSFTRARLDKYGKIAKVKELKKGEDDLWHYTGNIIDDNVASSLHYGHIGTERKASNGCVRIGGKELEKISLYIGTGSRIYTLPEKDGSRFTLKGGKINFTADNPYGVDDKDDEKRFWDDYNVLIDKSYTPITIKYKATGNKEYDENRKLFSQALVNYKKSLLKKFNLTSAEYNRLVELALGIALLETKFGTSTSYKLKKQLGEKGISILKALQKEVKPTSGRNLKNGWDVMNLFKNALFNSSPSTALLNLFRLADNGNKMALSRGFSQIKNKSDVEELLEIYRELGINNNSIKRADKSALATISRLAYMYNNEVKGAKFKGLDGNEIDPYQALLYKWNGHGDRLIDGTATPEINTYINNINKNIEDYDLYETRYYDLY